MADNVLFKIEQIIVDGQALAFEDGTGSLSGAARFANRVVPSASGDDFVRRERVATTLTMKLQFGNNMVPQDFASMHNVQITARDQNTGRRAMMPKCSFGEMGAIGGGSVDVTFNVLATIQWL
jgi:hypothetical protein